MFPIMNRLNRMNARFAVLLGCALLATAAGCGGGGIQLVSVQGTVTLDGQPLEDALVTFQPAEGRPSYGTTDSQGRYRLQYTPDRRGALPGQHQVVISTYVEPDTDSDDPVKQAGRPERVPEKFNKKSTLTAEVAPGRKGSYDFALQSGT